MRLITRNVYRAIPDLDGFSDETCRRIVSQVYRLRWIRITLAMIGTFVGMVPVAVIIALLLTPYIAGFAHLVGAKNETSGIYVGGTAIISIVVGLPAYTAFRVRNRMLLLGCRWLVERKDRCASCAYPLTGLRTAPDQTVRCPECGRDSKPDSAVSEIAAAAATSTTPQPSSSPHR